VVQVPLPGAPRQPGADRRAGVGKTAIVEGSPADVAGTCRVAQGQAGHRVDLGSMVAGATVPREFEERLKACSRRSPTAPARSSRSSTNCTRCRRRGREVYGCQQHDQAMLARGELRMVGATTLERRERIEKTRRWSGGSAGLRGRTVGGGHVGICAAEGALRVHHGVRTPTPRWPRRHPVRPLHHPPVLRTRPSTWSTRPPPGCAWRSTRGRWRSTRWSARCAAWQIEEMALAKRTTRPRSSG